MTMDSKLPADIRDHLNLFCNRKLSPPEFEQWVYKNTDQLLSLDDTLYSLLINTDYHDDKQLQSLLHALLRWLNTHHALACACPLWGISATFHSDDLIEEGQAPEQHFARQNTLTGHTEVKPNHTLYEYLAQYYKKINHHTYACTSCHTHWEEHADRHSIVVTLERVK